MELCKINPHIRYAREHHNAMFVNITSYCYDCRLFYIKKGTGNITVNGQKYQFSNNTAIFLPGGSKYKLALRKQVSAVTFLVFDFDLVQDFSHLKQSLGTADKDSFSPEKVIQYESPVEFTSIIIQNVPHLYETLKKCTDIFLFQTPYYLETSSAILKMGLLELLREHIATPISAKTNQMIDYIHEHYHETELTNEDVARAFNYHPYYASQLMKQSTGQTLHNYLLHYRIRVAKNFLITTDFDINTIAWKSGFNSVSYFIKLFKQHTGMTPRSYRKSRTNLIF